MEHEVIKIKNIRYMKDRIIYKTLLRHDIIYYKDIIKYYFKYGFHYGTNGKYLVLVTKDNVKHKLCLAVVDGFIAIGAFESTHLSLLKKLAPQAKYIYKVSIFKRIQKKLKQIDKYLKRDD